MFIISIPAKDKAALGTESGVSVKINGYATTLRRVGDYLEYQDETGKLNRCKVLDEHQDGRLIRFSAASDGDEDEPHEVIRPGKTTDATAMIAAANRIRHPLGIPPLAEDDRKWYWIAVNGPSVALYPLAVPAIMASPTPEQLFGFATFEEAVAAQKYLLHQPMKDVKAILREWENRIKARQMAYYRPEKPEPPTRGDTQWFI